jgi:diketogulonate reductase-like aldo/keto reductase
MVFERSGPLTPYESDAMTMDARLDETRELADGTEMPLLGLGVWQVEDGPDCVNAVRWALNAGYRHIDTAQAYGNEASVGRALRESGVPREDVFITTKFFPRHEDPAAEIEGSLRRLGVDQVDLYLVHWPAGGPTRAWVGMQKALERGHTRAIGVSNFSIAEVDELLAVADVRPVMNQVQFSAFEYRAALLAGCHERGLALTAYSSLGTGRHLDDPVVAAVAERLGRTPAQILLRWCLEKGTFVIPKSTHRERIEENGALFDFSLSEADIAELDALDTTGETDQAREGKWWR